jgi:hypothetical protein
VGDGNDALRQRAAAHTPVVGEERQRQVEQKLELVRQQLRQQEVRALESFEECEEEGEHQRPCHSLHAGDAAAVTACPAPAAMHRQLCHANFPIPLAPPQLPTPLLALPAGDLLAQDAAHAEWRRACELLELLQQDQKEFVRIYGTVYGIPKQNETAPAPLAELGSGAAAAEGR